MLTSHRSVPQPLSSSGPTFPALCPATARTVPVAVVASALCPDHRGLPSYGISVEWKEGSGGAGPVALVTALGASRGEPGQRGPGALKEPSVYPQAPVPPRGTARRASSPSPPIKSRFMAPRSRSSVRTQRGRLWFTSSTCSPHPSPGVRPWRRGRGSGPSP